MNYTIHQEAIYLFPSLMRAVEIAIVSKKKIKPFVGQEYGRQNAIEDFKVAGVMDLMDPLGKICYDHTPADFATLTKEYQEKSTTELREQFGKQRDKISPITSFKTNSACKLLLKTAFDRLTMSSNDYNILLEISGYIAALDGKSVILPEHMAEAIHYRVLDMDHGSHNDSIPVFQHHQ